MIPIKFHHLLLLTKGAAESVLGRYVVDTGDGRKRFGPAFYASASSILFQWIPLYVLWFYLPDTLRMEAYPPIESNWLDACVLSAQYGIFSGEWFGTCIFPQVATAWVMMVIVFTVVYALGLCQKNAEERITPIIRIPSHVEFKAIDFPIVALWALSQYLFLLFLPLVVVSTVLQLLECYIGKHHLETVEGVVGLVIFASLGFGIIYSLHSAIRVLSGSARYARAVPIMFACFAIVLAVPLGAVIVLWFSWVELNYDNVLQLLVATEHTENTGAGAVEAGGRQLSGPQMVWFVSSLFLPLGYAFAIGKRYSSIVKERSAPTEEV